MADWYGSSRSSYFAVRDEQVFRKLCKRWSLTVITNGDLFGFISDTSSGALPDWNSEVDTTNNENPVVELDFEDFIGELAECIAPGWQAVLMEVGAEKMRYLTGVAHLVNSFGIVATYSIWDIYKLALQEGKQFTRCEY